MGWIWGLAAFAALGLGSVMSVAVYDSIVLTNPPDYVHPRHAGFRYERDPKTLFGIAFEDVSIPSDGAVMRGWLVPGEAGDKTALIVVHGRGGDRTAPFLPLVPGLHRAGTTVLAIDLRENGTSDGMGRGTSFGAREADDIRSAVAFVKRRGYKTVVVAGCSLGASAAIIAAGRDPAIDGVVADSPIESLHLYVAGIMRRRLGGLSRLVPPAVTDLWGRLVVSIALMRQGRWAIDRPDELVAGIAPRPLLLIHGTRDESVAVAQSENLLARAGEPKSLWLVDGAGHCRAIRERPDAYLARVLDLIRAATAARPKDAAGLDAGHPWRATDAELGSVAMVLGRAPARYALQEATLNELIALPNAMAVIGTQDCG